MRRKPRPLARRRTPISLCLGAATTVVLFAAMALAASVAHALSPTPTRTNLVINGSVYAIAPGQGAIYLGGNFTHIGPPTGPGVGINASSGQNTGLPRVQGGYVYAVAPDGAGGFYVGGEFTKVGGVARRDLVHVLPNGSVDPNFYPSTDGFVRTIAISGSTVYVGGDFNQIGGQARNNLAAVDATTGAVRSWDPSPNSSTYDSVRALAISGSTVYVAGDFTSIGGQTRNGLAALNATTGTATSWDPNPNGAVTTLDVSGSTVYAGGYFKSIGGQTRNGLAALDVTTGDATSWNPNPTAEYGYPGIIYVLTVSGSTVYAAGYFESIGGQTRNGLAALNATTGDATGWAPPRLRVEGSFYDGSANALVVSGSTVYVGGNFDLVNGLPRYNLVALNASTGAPTSWQPNPDQEVNALAVSGSTVYVGGSFQSVGGQVRKYIAALNPTTGQVTSWNPSANYSDDGYCGSQCKGVRALAVAGSRVYAGGYFSRIGGKYRSGLAALDATTGVATNWNPNADNWTYSIAVSNGTVYAGGLSAIAAYDATTAARRWLRWVSTPDFCGHYCPEVNLVAASGSTVYVGGDFASIGTKYRNGLAALNTTNGGVTGWNPNPRPGGVSALAFSGSTIFAGGSFTRIGGQPRTGIAALNPTTGAAKYWNAHANGSVSALRVSGPALYASGSFTQIGGKPRNRLAALNASVGAATNWNPQSGAGNFLAFGPDGSLWTSATTWFKP